MTTIIIFFVSLLAILCMIYLKSRELKTGKRIWILRITEGADNFVYDKYLKVRLFISYFNRKSAVALVQWIAYHILSWARSTYLWVREKAHAHPPSKKVIDMVRGRGDVDSNGGASFYLKRISDEPQVKVKQF